MNKEEVQAQYHILFLRQNHRRAWGDTVEKLLEKMAIKVEKITKTRIFAIYSLFNADDNVEELDVIEKGKVVAKLFKKGETVDLHLMKRRKWVEVKDIPITAIKFSDI